MNGSGGETQPLESDLPVAKTGFEEPSSPTSTSGNNADDPASKVLRFLSTASPEAIAGIAVGLAAVTYLILGSLGLVLIGALGGIVLHASWEEKSLDGRAAEDARKEKALDIVKRLLDLREAREKDSDDETYFVGSTFEGFRPETATALNDLVDAVVRDYVKWWYHPILPKEESFPAAARNTLTKFIWAISNHLCRKRPADTFLDFLTNSSSIIIVFLSELSSAMAVSQGTNMSPAEAVHTYLAENPGSNLANVLDAKQQAKKFSMIAEDILQNFLDKPTFECDPAKAFLREILSGVVLETSLKSCSKPEWINGWIVYLLEEGEPDLNQAIDAGMGAINESNIDAIDGNIGSMSVAKAPKSPVARQEEKKHKKRLSKAEEAMEEAMEEARRLSILIAEEEKKKVQSPSKPSGLDSPFSPEILAKEPTTATSPSKSSNRSLAEFPLTSPNKNVAQSPPKSPIKTDEATGFASPPPLSAATDSSSLPAELNSPNWSDVRPLQNPPEPSNPSVAQLKTPISQPHSPMSGQADAAASPPSSHAPFTSFDQIIPKPIPRRQTTTLTLHNATVVIFDDSTAQEKGRMRNKPNGDILLQVEPKSDQHPGWMIVRKYSDFESLHEVLRRIAQISGVTAFAEQHNTLPSWKDHTKASLRGELERYLRDACWYQPLAESEGMKRFLEKDQGQAAYVKEKTGFGWNPSAFESMGKGMLDVLASAPKGVADGGKVIGTGITGVFSNIGNLGQKKAAPAPVAATPPAPSPQPVATNGSATPSMNGNSIYGGMSTGRSSSSNLQRLDSVVSLSGSRRGRESTDSLRPIIQTQPSMIQPMERRPSYNPDESDRETKITSARSSISLSRKSDSRDASQAPQSRRGTPLQSPLTGSMERFSLPPPPTDMPDDWYQVSEDPTSTKRSSVIMSPQARTSLNLPRKLTDQIPIPTPPLPQRKVLRDNTPLTDQETRVAVELIFAVINELYTLSSAWNIRRTLLTAAKQFLLRPGNPSLASIQSLIQDSIIASNTSDAGIAAHLRTLRANTLPTEAELAAWPADMPADEKARLRARARALFVANAIPEALKGVMGQAASEVAMGRIFDLVQEEEIARGLMFGLLLQGVRAITH